MFERIIRNSFCEPIYKTLTKDNFCVSSTNDRATAKGDSGGPLVLPKKSDRNNILIGVATSLHQRIKGSPVLFTSILPYLKWIKEKAQVAYYL